MQDLGRLRLEASRARKLRNLRFAIGTSAGRARAPIMCRDNGDQRSKSLTNLRVVIRVQRNGNTERVLRILSGAPHSGAATGISDQIDGAGHDRILPSQRAIASGERRRHNAGEGGTPMDTTEALEDRIIELEQRQSRFIPASTGTDGWSNYIESKLLQERSYTSGLLEEIIGGLRQEFADVVAQAFAQAARGTFDQKATYKAFDIVALNGGSFIARKDNPGPCPGDGWQLVARQGARGVAGEKGERGKDALSIVGWAVDAVGFTATPVMNDGRHGPPLKLREIFQAFLLEARL
jgi:hypothetical protein